MATPTSADTTTTTLTPGESAEPGATDAAGMLDFYEPGSADSPGVGVVVVASAFVAVATGDHSLSRSAVQSFPHLASRPPAGTSRH